MANKCRTELVDPEGTTRGKSVGKKVCRRVLRGVTPVREGKKAALRGRENRKGEFFRAIGRLTAGESSSSKNTQKGKEILIHRGEEKGGSLVNKENPRKGLSRERRRHKGDLTAVVRRQKKLVKRKKERFFSVGRRIKQCCIVGGTGNRAKILLATSREDSGGKKGKEWERDLYNAGGEKGWSKEWCSTETNARTRKTLEEGNRSREENGKKYCKKDQKYRRDGGAGKVMRLVKLGKDRPYQSAAVARLRSKFLAHGGS